MKPILEVSYIENVSKNEKTISGGVKFVSDRMMGVSVDSFEVSFSCDTLHDFDAVIKAMHSINVCLVK